MCNSQSKRGEIRNYISKKLTLTCQYTLHNPIYEKLILDYESNYSQARILKVILKVRKLGKIE